MAKNKKREDATLVDAPKKRVRNKGINKVELLIDDKVVVIRAGESIDIPEYIEIPNGIGVYEV